MSNYLRDFFKNKYAAGFLIVVVLVAFGGGYWVGELNPPVLSQVVGVSNTSSSSSTNADFSIFWKAWNILNTDYVPTHSTTTPTDQSKIYGAIQGLAASYGDPYTVFFPPADNQSFQDQISGTFDGVGMEVDLNADGVLTVISPIQGTPAYNAGIKAGDQILSINGTSTNGMSADVAINLIKGPKGTVVTLSILRTGSKTPISISVTRDVINVPTVVTKTVGDVFVISVYEFSAPAADDFRNALRQFVTSGKSKLVVDLRGNPGGYLEAAVDMASWFLPSGDTVVSEVAKTAADSQVYRSEGYDIFNDNLQMVILIDGGSASASEIFSGAMHDHGKAVLVGEKSYGKGSVQELMPITPDTSLKVTIAKWYTPNGVSISLKGIEPDVPVAFDQTKYLANGDDTQLDKAVEILDNSTEYSEAQAGDFASSTAAVATSTATN
jgi:carboxyl-terminal processing protease